MNDDVLTFSETDVSFLSHITQSNYLTTSRYKTPKMKSIKVQQRSEFSGKESCNNKKSQSTHLKNHQKRFSVVRQLVSFFIEIQFFSSFLTTEQGVTKNN